MCESNIFKWTSFHNMNRSVTVSAAIARPLVRFSPVFTRAQILRGEKKGVHENFQLLMGVV